MEKYLVLAIFIIVLVAISLYLLYRNSYRLTDFQKKISLVVLFFIIAIYSKMIFQRWSFLNIQDKIKVANVFFILIGVLSLFYPELVKKNQNKFDRFINKHGLLITVSLLSLLYIIRKVLN